MWKLVAWNWIERVARKSPFVALNPRAVVGESTSVDDPTTEVPGPNVRSTPHSHRQFGRPNTGIFDAVDGAPCGI